MVNRFAFYWQLGVVLLVKFAFAESGSWSFSKGSVTVTDKFGVQRFSESVHSNDVLSQLIVLDDMDTLTVTLNCQENMKNSKPAQAELLLSLPESNLQEGYFFTVDKSGQATVKIPFKSIPVQLLVSNEPIIGFLILGSFGSTTGYDKILFRLSPKHSATNKLVYKRPLRYEKLPEIRHKFQPEPKSASMISVLLTVTTISLAFPILLISWSKQGANFSQFTQAMKTAPYSHLLYFGSIVMMDVLFFFYFKGLSLFDLLKWATGVAAVMLLSGSQALTELQARRAFKVK